MSDRPPATIGEHRSGVISGHAVMSGFAAAMIVELVGPRWRQTLVRSRVLGDDLAKVEEAMASLERAAAVWRAERLGALAAARGSNGLAAEGRDDTDGASSRPWMTTREAAEQLRLSERRIRQLVEEGSLSAAREGGRLFLVSSEVVALRELRRAA